MLSIIVSSYQPHYFNALEKNIAETCGIPYEIIKINNPGLMGICEAYNIGACQATYENILFLHEDLLFRTQNWGANLTEKLRDPNTGVIGVAGSAYVPAVPFAWWDMHTENYLNLNQYNNSELITEYRQTNDKEVLTVDGVFLACRKSVWQQHLFNEQIRSFHGYDVDFSVRVADTLANFVTSEILINHYSQGTKDKRWFDALIITRDFFAAPKKQETDKKKELYFYNRLKENLELLDFEKKEKRKILLKYNRPKYIGYKAAFRNLKEIFL